MKTVYLTEAEHEYLCKNRIKSVKISGQTWIDIECVGLSKVMVKFSNNPDFKEGEYVNTEVS